MSSKTNNYWLYAPSITQLANVYFDIGNLDTAAKYYNLSLEIRRQTEDKSIIVIGLLDIGEYYFGANKYDDAIIYLEEGLDIAKEVGYPRQILKATQLLYQTYDKLGNIHKAYDMHKLYSTMKDSLNNVEARENSMKQLALYEFEKAKQKAKEKARVEAEEIQRIDNLEYSLIFLGILLLFGGVLMLGFIKVSANVAEGLIFFSFLILFEFVLVFVEPYLNEYTDGEPIYTLLINAGIALLIFPLHDKLETVLKKRIVKK